MERETAAGTWIGRPMRRREDPRLLMGRGRYLGDLRQPGAATVAILRSPYAHARIRSISTERAAVARGVVAVVTGQEIASAVRPFPNLLPALRPVVYYPLAIDRVRFAGEPVAAV